MKKILSIMCVSILSFSLAQSYTTGTVGAGGITIKIDTNPTTVTLTATAPAISWFGFGFGGSTMPTVSDMFIWSDAAARDYTPSGGNSAPSPDGVQSWTLVSDNVVSGTRTVVYTRPLASSGDYTFTNNATSIPIIYAAGGTTTTLGYHGSLKNSITLTRTLGVEDIAQQEIKISIYPNPAKEYFQLENNDLVKQIVIYDATGKNVAQFSQQESYEINTLKAGTYFVEIQLENNEITYEKFIKE